MSKPTFLALYPSTRGFSFVCFEQPDVLIDYGVIKINPISNKKIIARIEKIMDYINPDVILLNNPMINHYFKNRRVQDLFKEIEQVCYDNKLSFYSYSRDEIKQSFLQFNASTKYQIAQKLVEIFPELESRKPSKREIWQKEDYFMGIFDALSLVITHKYLEE